MDSEGAEEAPDSRNQTAESGYSRNQTAESGYLQKEGNHGEYEGSIAHGENHFQQEEGQCMKKCAEVAYRGDIDFQQEEGQCMKKCAEVAYRGDIDPQYGQTPCDYPEDGETPCDLQEDDNAVTKSEYSRQCKTKNIVNKHSHHSTFQNTSPMAENDYRGKKINYGGNCETNCIENIDKPSRHSATPKTHERKTSRAPNPNTGDPPLSSCSLTEKTSSTPNPEAGKPPLPQSPKIPAETNRKDARAARREQSARDKPSSSQHNKANDPDAEIPCVDCEENRQGPPEQSTPHTKGAISLHDFDYKSKEASKFERRY